MRSLVIVLAVLLVCIGIGEVLGNPGGGLVVGVVLAIVLAKRFGTTRSAPSI